MSTQRLTPLGNILILVIAMPIHIALASSPYDAQLLQLTNAERDKRGIAPLEYSTLLGKIAQRHAADMANHKTLTHTGSDGSTPSERFGTAQCAYLRRGENIAAGYASPQRILQNWMASEGHRSNILDARFNQVGFGFAHQPDSDMRYYWVQVFGRFDSERRLCAVQLSSDPDARLLAALLAEIGYFTQPLTTYIEPSALQSALQQFQRDMGLPATGRLDKHVWQTLQTVELSQPNKAWLQQEGLSID